MRTTLTLDPEVEALVRREMRERGLSFKQTVNEAIRAALDTNAGRVFQTPTFDMGESAVPLTKALAIAAELEDDEIVRKLALRK